MGGWNIAQQPFMGPAYGIAHPDLLSFCHHLFNHMMDIRKSLKERNDEASIIFKGRVDSKSGQNGKATLLVKVRPDRVQIVLFQGSDKATNGGFILFC